MTLHATGTFDVQITPNNAPDAGAGSTLGQLTVNKQFHGDLEGDSKGQMLSAGTDVPGSAVYVVIEHVTGTLNGRKGSFALAHKGVMTRGTPEQNITIVPDSGTEQLKGISGTLTITIIDKKHRYDLEYQLADGG